jgi:hypothetical protein
MRLILLLMALKPSKQTAINSLIEGLALAAFLLVVATLAGCDADLDRQVHRAQINEAFRSACLPASDERVIVQWREGILICARAPNSYKRRVGNTPAIVAHAEDVK